MEEKITLQTDTGEAVDFFVLEETRINGMNYLLVTDSEEEEDGECYILKDVSKAEDSEAVYEFVENDDEMDYLFKIFTELMEDMDVPLEFRKEPADDNPPIDDDEQDRRLPGCTPQATGIRFEDMGLAVRVAVSGEAASEEERIQAGKTLAELRNTPMFEQLTSGDAKREERIGSLIELHLAAYRKRKQPDSEPAAETIPDTFSISDIV